MTTETHTGNLGFKIGPAFSSTPKPLIINKINPIIPLVFITEFSIFES